MVKILQSILQKSNAPKTNDNRFKSIGFLALIILVLDQLTKEIILHTLPLNRSIEVIPNFFNIVHVQNRGAAFGFLNNPEINWQLYLFTVATILALGLIYYIAKSSPYSKFLNYAFGLIVGGALGNFIDRIRFQAVTDFLDFYLGAWHWPAFNVADIAITLGALASAFFLYRLETIQKKSSHIQQ